MKKNYLYQAISNHNKNHHFKYSNQIKFLINDKFGYLEIWNVLEYKTVVIQGETETVPSLIYAKCRAFKNEYKIELVEY